VLYAYGVGAERVHGVIEQTVVFNIISNSYGGEVFLIKNSMELNL